MSVVDLSISKKEEEQNKLETINDTIREEILEYAKDFKTSWVNLGRHLYAVWQDKLFYAWGYEKFEDYTEREIGLKKSLCLKLLKAYLFVEQDEPAYLEQDFRQRRQAVQVPHYDAVDVLRLAKRKKELLADDYAKLRSEVFERGVDASKARKDLTSLIKERKLVDPEEEREQRNRTAIKKFMTALEMFKRDMETLKLIPNDILEEVQQLRRKIESQVT